jgi:MFS family permease
VFRRNPDFARLFAGQVVSFGGDWFLTVALLDLVLDLTDSGFMAALLLVCQTLPAFLLAPYAGTVVDRVNRQRLMIGVNLFAAVMALLPLLARSQATLPFAFLGVIGISCGMAFFSPASQAALPNVVRPSDLVRANVLMSAVWGTMLAVGAALGGAVTAALGRNAAFLVDCASFVIAAGLLWSIRSPFQTAVGRRAESFRAAMGEAARYARQHRPVLALLTSKGGYGLSTGVLVLLSVFAKEVFDAGAIGIGLFFAFRGIGALMGPFLMRRLGGTDAGIFSLIGLGIIAHGIGYSLFAIAPLFSLALLFVLAAHVGGGGSWAMSTYGLQRLTPDELRGRIFSADFGFYTLTTTFSSLAAGLLADTLGPRPTALLLGGLALAWGVFWTLWTRDVWRGLRASETSPSPTPQAAPAESGVSH